MKEIENYREMGKSLIDKLKLLTYPIAVKLANTPEEVPDTAIRPKDMFGSEVPACLVYSWCRRSGLSFYLEGSDIACKPISIKYFGLDSIADNEDVYKAWTKKAAYRRDIEAEKESRKNDAVLEPGEISGLIISPLNETVIEPDVIMVYCSPLILSHLILAATYDGNSLTSHFDGMESSCKDGIIRTYKTDQCQVVCPGMGDRVMAGVQDHEMIFAIPISKLEMLIENLFLAGNKLSPLPFKIPHLMATLGPISAFGKPNEPGVWPLLRRKLKKKGE